MTDLPNMIPLLYGIESSMLRNLIVSLLVIVILWGVRYIALGIVFSKTEDIRKRYFWQKTTKYIAFIIGIVAISMMWLQGGRDITTYLAVLSAGMAIALKDILANIAGWFFLIWVRPIGVEDRIQIGEYAGDVIDISLFHITLLEIGNWVNSDQSTGRIIQIPNGRVFTEALANFSKGFQYIWNEIPVLVTFESDWQKAKHILLEIARKHTENLSEEAELQVLEASKRFMIFYKNLTPTVYTSVVDSGVLLTIRYLCEPRRRRGSAETIWEDILTELSERDDIDFAYPTTRFFNNVVESKEGARTQ